MKPCDVAKSALLECGRPDLVQHLFIRCNGLPECEWPGQAADQWGPDDTLLITAMHLQHLALGHTCKLRAVGAGFYLDCDEACRHGLHALCRERQPA